MLFLSKLRIIFIVSDVNGTADYSNDHAAYLYIFESISDTIGFIKSTHQVLNLISGQFFNLTTSGRSVIQKRKIKKII
jgi:hypothetical protein